MAIFLSPGVFSRELDLTALPSSFGPITPAFLGTAKKGPFNTPVLCTSPQQYIDTFGEPFPESYLGYNVLTYFEEGDSCYVMRIGVEYEEGQDADLQAIAVDTSGSKTNGWGRIALFSGIDYGKINLREVGDGLDGNPEPLVFHASAITDIDYNDADVSTTDGATTATLNTSGSYTGDIDDTYVMVITSDPNVSDGSSIGGAEYQIIRNSDGEVVSEGTLVDDGANGTSQYINTGDGFSVQVEVTDGVLETNDTFTWSVRPDNRKFTILVDSSSGGNEYTMPSATYTTVADFVDAANLLLSSEDYLFVEYTLDDGVTTVPQLRTDTAGERIQIDGTNAWALECGTVQYEWDIPRSYLIGTDSGPFSITTSNNRVKINVIGDTVTKTVEFSIPSGSGQTVAAIAAIIDSAGTIAGSTLWNSYELTVPGGSTHIVIETTSDYNTATLELLANFSNLKTLRFAEEVGIAYPYKKSYRGFVDNRVVLPLAGESDTSVPLSCEDDSLSDECALDTAYFANIVGYLVATSPGTWIDDVKANLSIYTQGLGDASGRYQIVLTGAQNEVIDSIDDVSFDKTNDRYIGNVVNPGTKYGGTNGNPYVNWEERPAYLNNDATDVSSYEVRQPSQFSGKEFIGGENGIPTDAAYSSELDAALIGNPALSTGLYAFQNPESISIRLLATPGFSSGSVIGTALQLCESRGDCVYIVDPPFGLRPQQVVDWHNGMLLSDVQTSINSSYGALYWSWLKIFDQFNAIELWTPPSGYIAGVFSRTARTEETWSAPAGRRRGRLITARDVEYSPSTPEQALLYGNSNSVNPIIKFPRDGIMVYGIKTLERSNSAFSRLNVRMVSIEIKTVATDILRDFVFEPNDSILWKQVEAALQAPLSDIQARRGLEAYKVVVNESINTPERIDRGELWVNIFFKPKRIAEIIVLTVAALRTGASFSSEETLAATGLITPSSVS